MSLTYRLDKHFAGAAAVAVGAGMATTAHAAIVFQSVSINVPNNVDGLYLNVVTMQQGSSSFAGYDINPYSTSATALNLWGPTVNTWYSVGGNYNLPPITMIGGPDSNFSRPGSTDVGSQFTMNSSNNVLGFRFVNEANGNQVHYGWIRMQFGANPGIRTIIEIGYESNAGVAVPAGYLPAPGALGVLGVVGLANTRRRRQ